MDSIQTSAVVISDIDPSTYEAACDQMYRTLVGLVSLSALIDRNSSSEDLHADFRVEFRQESGFLCDILGRVAVVTAGHVLSAIESDFSPPRRRLRFGIADRGPAPQHSTSVPVRWEECARFKVDLADAKVDFGAVILPAFETETILRGGSVSVISPAQIADPHDKFDAYVVLGFPVSARQRRLYRNHVGTVTSEALGTPFLPVTPVLEVPSALRANHDRFVAHIDVDDPFVRDIKGMSGGPVFGITRAGTGLKMTLVAIQSSWNQSSRTIAAEYAKPFVHAATLKFQQWLSSFDPSVASS